MAGDDGPGDGRRARAAGRRAEIGDEILADLRRYSVVAHHVGQVFAGRHGLNATDLHALIAVLDAERAGEPITPSRLGEQLNLTSGSVTALLDRLERAGHVRRARDAVDRRKVLLRYAEPGARLAREFFGPLGRRADAVLDQFTESELQVVHRFLRLMVAAMREHRDEVRAGS